LYIDFAYRCPNIGKIPSLAIDFRPGFYTNTDLIEIILCSKHLREIFLVVRQGLYKGFTRLNRRSLKFSKAKNNAIPVMNIKPKWSWQALKEIKAELPEYLKAFSKPFSRRML
jgi:hypothetical protein